MPARSTVDLLPEPVREQLNERLVRGSFADYRGLADWLAQEGFQITKSALQRYGQKFEERVSALKLVTEQARAIVKESPDTEGAINEALMRLVQEKLYNLVLEAEIDTTEPINLAKVARAIADLGRTDITRQKWLADARAKAREVAKDASAELRKAAGTGVVSDATIAAFSQRILGIAK